MHKLLSIFLVLLFYCNYSTSQYTKPPKLVVGIVVDQMCYDYLYRFQDRFSKDGFRKLMENGVNCRNTHFNYIPTYTAPGHASIYTGTTPSNHKVVANDWYDREKKRLVYCVEDSSFGKSPLNLKALTITDQLKLTYPSSKVYSISLKDRSAILPGGHLSDGSFWFDEKEGRLKTSLFYPNSMSTYLDAFNRKNYAKNAILKGWEPLFKEGSYAYWYKDSSNYEQSVFKSNQFPYILKDKFTDKEEYKLFTYLPAANTMLTDFSIELIENQKLGNDLNSDFLCLSYSSTDILGHAFGPYSHEVEDMYLRLDLELSRLLKYLEKKIGKDNFILFLTADHAVLPVPQMLVDLKLPGGYFQVNEFEDQLRNEVKSQFNFDFILKIINNNIYFDRALLEEKSIDYEKAMLFVKSKLLKINEVFHVYTSTELQKGLINENLWSNLMLNGFDQKLSGDVLFILNPGYLSKKEFTVESKKGTSHGSPFGYDTQVPLLFYGKNIKKKEVYRHIEITDIVPTLSPLLNISQPATTIGKPILEVLEK
jgi:predicted AlkP superfamily pyrophosphatase or phosphodiesterase